MPRPFQAIAAMSLNRVIGANNQLPWHLPEDFRWFKATTTGHIVVMGRKTFESIGRPLPNRITVVLSRSSSAMAGVIVAPDLASIESCLPPGAEAKRIFICGGASIYEQALPLCSDLYLTLVKRTVSGDTFFPPFEHLFTLAERILESPEFDILHYTAQNPSP